MLYLLPNFNVIFYYLFSFLVVILFAFIAIYYLKYRQKCALIALIPGPEPVYPILGNGYPIFNLIKHKDWRNREYYFVSTLFYVSYIVIKNGFIQILGS